MKKVLKILGYMLLGAWTLFGILLIISSHQMFDTVGFSFLIGLFSLPYIIILTVWLSRKRTHKRQATLTTPFQSVSNADLLKSSHETCVETIPNTSGSISEEITDEELREIMQAEALNAMRSMQTSSNPKFHRTDNEEKRSAQFLSKHGHTLQIYVDSFEETYRLASKAESLGYYDKALEKYNEAIAKFNEAQAFAYRFGEGGQIYFDDMWNHMHNSRNPDFSWKTWPEGRIREIVLERDYLIPELKRIIGETPGILQKDTYQYFKPELKSKIQELLKELSDGNVIYRTKKGSSYSLFIK